MSASVNDRLVYKLINGDLEIVCVPWISILATQKSSPTLRTYSLFPLSTSQTTSHTSFALTMVFTMSAIAFGITLLVVILIIAIAIDNHENAPKMPHKASVPVQVESRYEVIEREDTKKKLIEGIETHISSHQSKNQLTVSARKHERITYIRQQIFYFFSAHNRQSDELPDLTCMSTQVSCYCVVPLMILTYPSKHGFPLQTRILPYIEVGSYVQCGVGHCSERRWVCHVHDDWR
jgi:hypothetical protein